MRRRSPLPGSYQREIRLGKIGPIGQIPLEPFAKAGHRVEQGRLQHFHGQQRHEAD